MGNSTLPLGGGDTSRLSEIIIQLGHGFVAGDVVRTDPATPGEYILAQADTSENAEAVGIVESVAGDSFELVYQGRVDISAVAWTDLPFTAPGEVWFLSDTVAGELTKTPPSTAGTVIKAMLVVTDDTGGVEAGLLTGYIGVQIGGENIITLEQIQPLGTILPWAADAATPAPTGWAICNGQAISRTTFSDLFTLISTTYGVGDGSTTFNVPDLRGRTGIGLDGVSAGVLTGNNLAGDSGGEEEHTLTSNELPDHSHDHDTLSVFDPGAGTPYTAVVVPPGSSTIPVGSLSGGGDTHNDMQPFLVINFIIRTTELAAAALLDHNLGDHSDVDVLRPSDQPIEPEEGDSLAYNTATNKWEAHSLAGLRNFLGNGNFSCWQRSVVIKQTAAFPGAAAAPLEEYTQPTLANDFFIACDRWRHAVNIDVTGTATASGKRFDFAQGQTDVPGNPRFYIKRQGFVTGGGGDANVRIDQRIERSDTLSGKTCTVSFWARGDGTTGPGNETGAIGFQQVFDIPTGGDPTVVIPFQNFTLISNTWVFYKFTFNIPSVAGKTIGTGGNNFLLFKLLTHVDVTEATLFSIAPFSYTGFVDYAQVQVEEGLIATPFERRSFQEEFDLCQRYFSTGNVHHYRSHGPISEMSHNVTFPVELRAAPTITIFDLGSVNIGSPAVVGPVNFPNFGRTQFFYQQDILAGPFSGFARYVWSADTDF